MSSNPTPISNDFLYKYRAIDESNVERSRRIFTFNEVYLATKNEFNDPFDCKSDYSFTGTDKQKKAYFSPLIEEEYPKLNRKQRKAKLADLMKSDVRSPIFKRTIDTSTEKLHASLGIYSLTRVHNDILMWSHYSDSHKGFCLQFADDPTDKFFTRAQEVTYLDDYPIVNPFTEDRMTRWKKSLLTKARHWEYEKEWRIIDLKGPGVQKFPEPLLVGVIFGCRMSEDNKALIREWCAERKTPPTFYQAKEASKEYALDIKEM